ncbi:MAG TPA: hypothetical protein VEB43_10210 [Anaeromyxobacter sp.]|nr:hypothetical protein [Anaeromyxobacter sp.]
MIVRTRAAPFALALLLAATPRSTPAEPLAVDDTQRDAIAPSKVVITIVQDELAFAEPTVNLVGSDLLTAIAVMKIDEYRVAVLRREALPLRDALLFHDARSTALAVFGGELAKTSLLQHASVEVSGKARSACEGLDAGTGAVLLIDLNYRISPDVRNLVVAAAATLVAAKGDDPPCAPLYRREFVTAQRPPNWKTWSADHGAAAAAAIDGGIAEIARMLAWDLAQPAPASGSYAFTGFGKQFAEFGEYLRWAPDPVRQVDGRLWFRSGTGVLASTGGRYPALPDAVNKVRIARVTGTSKAASYQPSSTQQLAGAIGGVEIRNPAARNALDAAMRDAEAKQRAFGTTASGPEDPTYGITLDRLTQGRTVFAPDLEVYARTALERELRAMGLAVAAKGRPQLRGEIVEATVDRSPQGIAATLRLRWAVTDPAGTALWTAEKTATTLAEERAENEVEAFHTVLRKSAEALALDPAFAAAVK